MRYFLFLTLLLIFGCSPLLWAQEDAALIDPDTSNIEVLPESTLSRPARAALLSAALPGLGQYHNRKAWAIKVPIIYGVGATLVWLTLDNHADYRFWRDAFIAINDGNPDTEPPLSIQNIAADQILRRRDNERRDRDYYTILTALFYVLQIGEAATTAHLSDFDVSDDLSIRLQPHTEPLTLYPGAQSLGMSLKLSF